jgi:hypothetical protein
MAVTELAAGIFAGSARTLSGDGPVDAKGRSVDRVDDRNPSDLDFETENPAVATEEEAWEDAVGDAER